MLFITKHYEKKKKKKSKSNLPTSPQAQPTCYACRGHRTGSTYCLRTRWMAADPRRRWWNETAGAVTRTSWDIGRLLLVLWVTLLYAIIIISDSYYPLLNICLPNWLPTWLVRYHLPSTPQSWRGRRSFWQVAVSRRDFLYLVSTPVSFYPTGRPIFALCGLPIATSAY